LDEVRKLDNISKLKTRRTEQLKVEKLKVFVFKKTQIRNLSTI